MSIRCRYAPSPTGNQHIGGLRTALFNYLLARSPHGAAAGAPDGGERRFILRLEDTDRSRYDAAFVKDLYDTFDWIGFRWDEGPDSGGPAAPYVQSERFDLYAGFAAQLLESGAAYRCFCTAARLDAVRAERDAARARGEAGASESGYDRHCRALDAREAASRAASGEAYVIRLKIPLEETTRFTDALLGDISWKNSDISPDPVLIKSDGFPTYHLANIVDDHLMGITHVLRAQEWLSSTPLHVILYKAFGWQPPLFCHLPMVVGADGKKLSKRHGSTSVQEFRRAGYLPAALVNYVALLGASYQEGKDIYSLDELAALFSLAKLNKAPAVFDYKKLDWFNSQYIKAAPDEVLAQAVLPYMVEAGIFAGGEADGRQFALLCAAMPLIKERAVRLTEIPAKIAFVFNDPPVAPPEEFIAKKSSPGAARAALGAGAALLGDFAGMDDVRAEALAKDAAERAGLKTGDLLMPLRVAITGSRVSPPLFASIRVLGEAVCRRRVGQALEVLAPL